MLVGNGVGQSLRVNSTFSCVNLVLTAQKYTAAIIGAHAHTNESRTYKTGPGLVDINISSTANHFKC